MSNLLPSFYESLDKVTAEIQNIEGFLTPREIKCLFTLAYFPTAEGDILEIGSFKGKSTVLLAKASKYGNSSSKIIAVDPLTSPSPTDPDLKGAESGAEDFYANLQSADVSDSVEFHQTFSYKLAESWARPLRFLWIDGDHTYEGARKDFDLFSPYLTDGAMIAFHDVLHGYDGPLRVFIEQILLDDHFSTCKLIGSIAFAKYHKDPSHGRKEQHQKKKLYRQMRRLVPYVVFDGPSTQLKVSLWKFWRVFVPHAEPKLEELVDFINPLKTSEKIII